MPAWSSNQLEQDVAGSQKNVDTKRCRLGLTGIHLPFNSSKAPTESNHLPTYPAISLKDPSINLFFFQQHRDEGKSHGNFKPLSSSASAPFFYSLDESPSVG